MMKFFSTMVFLFTAALAAPAAAQPVESRLQIQGAVTHALHEAPVRANWRCRTKAGEEACESAIAGVATIRLVARDDRLVRAELTINETDADRARRVGFVALKAIFIDWRDAYESYAKQSVGLTQGGMTTIEREGYEFGVGPYRWRLALTRATREVFAITVERL